MSALSLSPLLSKHVTHALPLHRTRSGQFASPADEIDSLRRHVAELQDTLKETEASLVEFEESSKDVEREMDKEIRDAERRERELRTQVERSNAQIDEWKVS